MMRWWRCWRGGHTLLDQLSIENVDHTAGGCVVVASKHCACRRRSLMSVGYDVPR